MATIPTLQRLADALGLLLNVEFLPLPRSQLTSELQLQAAGGWVGRPQAPEVPQPLRILLQAGPFPLGSAHARANRRPGPVGQAKRHGALRRAPVPPGSGAYATGATPHRAAAPVYNLAGSLPANRTPKDNEDHWVT